MSAKLLAIVWLSAGLAAAQGSWGGGGGRGGGRGGSAGGSPETGTRMDRITETLSLDKDQRKQIYSILEDGFKESESLRDQLPKSRLELGSAVAEGSTGDDLKRTIHGYAALQSQMAVLEMKAFVAIFKILNQDQRAKAGPVFRTLNGVFLTKNWNAPTWP